MQASPTVSVIDPDEATRKHVRSLCASVNLETRFFAAPADFLGALDDQVRGCTLVETHLPGMTGIELLRHMQTVGSAPPAIVLTAHADVPTAIAAMRAGAFDYFEKPPCEEALLERIYAAIESDRRACTRRTVQRVMQARHATLTPREREVMQCIVAGMPNKSAALRLGLTAKAVEAYRARVMRKMRASNLAELVRMSIILEGDGNPLDLVHAMQAPAEAAPRAIVPPTYGNAQGDDDSQVA